MDQCAGLEKFEGGCGGDCCLTVLPTSTSPAPIAERRPQTLTTAEKLGNGLDEGFQIRTDVRKERHLLGEELIKAALNAHSKLLGVQGGIASGK